MENFSDRFAQWLDDCQKIVDDHNTKNGYQKEVLSLDDGQKLIRIVIGDGNRRSCWAFVAKENYTTKALGEVKQGDIFKPASWKAPAAKARGNIFDEHKGLSKITKYGPEYLR